MCARSDASSHARLTGAYTIPWHFFTFDTNAKNGTRGLTCVALHCTATMPQAGGETMAHPHATVDPTAIVASENFILATRETGYRDVAAAVAELIDNALQACARE